MILSLFICTTSCRSLKQWILGRVPTRSGLDAYLALSNSSQLDALVTWDADINGQDRCSHFPRSDCIHDRAPLYGNSQQSSHVTPCPNPVYFFVFLWSVLMKIRKDTLLNELTYSNAYTITHPVRVFMYLCCKILHIQQGNYEQS